MFDPREAEDGSLGTVGMLTKDALKRRQNNAIFPSPPEGVFPSSPEPFQPSLWSGEGSKTLLLQEREAGRKRSVRSLHVGLFGCDELEPEPVHGAQEKRTEFEAEPQSHTLLPSDAAGRWPFVRHRAAGAQVVDAVCWCLETRPSTPSCWPRPSLGGEASTGVTTLLCFGDLGATDDAQQWF